METPKAGTQVGQYILEEKLGEGGMAEVWRARNAVLGHSAAIKFLAVQFAGKPDVEHRFLEEGKRQAHLQHPNIVSAFDFVYVEGRSFLVMKYIKGESLDHRLFRLQSPMPLPSVLSISRDVLGALDYAHSEGVVHRDIKPSNILIENTERAHLLDFGIALAVGQERVTRIGMAIGTPHYMSPEQIIGSKDLDHRTDIYSYGCVLYQMLTQVPPFDYKEGEGDTEYFIKDQHLREPARPPRELNPTISDAMERVVLRCLEKKPSDRFQSCNELLNALVEPQTQRVATGTFRTATVLESAAMTAAAGSSLSRSGATVYSPVEEHRLREPLPATPSLDALRGLAAETIPVPARRRNRVLLLGMGGVAVALAATGGAYWWMSQQSDAGPSKRSQTIVQQHDIQKIGKDTSTPEKRPEPNLNTTRHKNPLTATDTAPVRHRESSPTDPIRTPSIPVPRSEPVISQPAGGTVSSGVLRCSSASVASYGGRQGFLFRDLPKHLQFPSTFTANWILHAERRDAEHQDLLLIPRQPGMTNCEVPWSVR